MEIALYGEHGFYATSGAAGRRGDFITSAEVGPLFGAVIVAQNWKALGDAGRAKQNWFWVWMALALHVTGFLLLVSQVTIELYIVSLMNAFFPGNFSRCASKFPRPNSAMQAIAFFFTEM